MAGIVPTDKIIIIDESTSKTDFQTRKTIYEERTKNEKEISAFSFKQNFLGCLGLNTESTLFAIENLDEFEFGKSLFKLKSFYSDSKNDIELLNEAIENYSLSKKEIRKKLEEQEDNPEFLKKLLRSIKNNKNDKSMVLARKLNKHCKSESTENINKRKEIQKEHVYQLIEQLNLEQQLKHDRLVIFLDSAPAHTSTFVKNIAKKLNILFVDMPKYSPWLNPVEKVWNILKDHFRSIAIYSKSELKEEGFKVFNQKCLEPSLTGNFIREYLPVLC